MIIYIIELKELRKYLLLNLIYFVNHNYKFNVEFVI